MTTGGRWAGSPPEDELLSLLYQQVTELQAARFGTGYDLATGAERFLSWLHQHAAANQMTPAAAQASTPGARPARPGTHTPATVLAGPTQAAVAEARRAGRDADAVVGELYRAHYRSLVRLAALLVRDAATAEEVVQDAFVAMHGAWGRLRDTDKALAYLRRAVISRCRSVLRHRAIVGKYPANPVLDAPDAGRELTGLPGQPTVIAALRGLPARQREALVLRYYAGLSEAQIAAAMGISRGAVKSHTARGMAALRAVMEQPS